MTKLTVPKHTGVLGNLITTLSYDDQSDDPSLIETIIGFFTGRS
ncbi:hypothetical protein [Agrilactobacillus composti]|nr:hypothetical protein [Agrilactobacillus composti]